MLIDIYMQFPEDIFSGFQVTYSGHDFVTDNVPREIMHKIYMQEL